MIKLKNAKHNPFVARDLTISHPIKLQDQKNKPAYWHKQNTATKTKTYIIKFDSFIQLWTQKKIKTIGYKKEKQNFERVTVLKKKLEKLKR